MDEATRGLWMRWHCEEDARWRRHSVGTGESGDKNRFMEYLRLHFVQPRLFFSEWPLDLMEQQSYRWQRTLDERCFYLRHQQQRLTAHVARHIPGSTGSDSAGGAVGADGIVFYVVVPPLRNWRIEELRRCVAKGSADARTLRLLLRVHTMHLDWHLAFETLDRRSNLYMPGVAKQLHGLALPDLRRHLLLPPAASESEITAVIDGIAIRDYELDDGSVEQAVRKRQRI